MQTAADGRTALALIVADPPDLVLADVMMPHLDGFGLLAALRAEPATAHLPVVLLSARAGPEAAAEGLAAGADDYLVKPFSGEELLARVRANLDRARDRLRRGEWATQVVKSLTDGVWVADENGVIFQVDETFAGSPGTARRRRPTRRRTRGGRTRSPTRRERHCSTGAGAPARRAHRGVRGAVPAPDGRTVLGVGLRDGGPRPGTRPHPAGRHGPRRDRGTPGRERHRSAATVADRLAEVGDRSTGCWR